MQSNPNWNTDGLGRGGGLPQHGGVLKGTGQLGNDGDSHYFECFKCLNVVTVLHTYMCHQTVHFKSMLFVLANSMPPKVFLNMFKIFWVK